MKTNLFVNRLMSIMMPTMMFVMNGVSILIIWVGSKKVDIGTLQVGDLMAFITYTMQIIMSFLMISMVSIMLPRAWISVKRIAEVLNKEITVKDKGVGIPDIPKAMEPMFTTDIGSERAGLGFAVMQAFMDKVKVYSSPGKGTRVVMTKNIEQE